MTGKAYMLFLAAACCTNRTYCMMHEIEKNPEIIQAGNRVNDAFQHLVQQYQQDEIDPLFQKYAAINACNTIKENFNDRKKQLAVLKTLLHASIKGLKEFNKANPAHIKKCTVGECCQTQAVQSIVSSWHNLKNGLRHRQQRLAKKYANPSTPISQQTFDNVLAVCTAIEQYVTTMLALIHDHKVGDIVSPEAFDNNYATTFMITAMSAALLRTLEQCIDDGVFDTNNAEIKKHIALFEKLVAANASSSELNREAVMLVLMSLRPLKIVVERMCTQIPLLQAQTFSTKLSTIFERIVTQVSDDDWVKELPAEVTEDLQQLMTILWQEFKELMGNDLPQERAS